MFKNANCLGCGITLLVEGDEPPRCYKCKSENKILNAVHQIRSASRLVGRVNYNKLMQELSASPSNDELIEYVGRDL